jgi:hypothetical protein
MARNLSKLLIGSMVVVLWLAACAPAAAVTTDQVKALEDKVNSLSELKTQVTALQGEISTIKGSQASVSALQSRLDGIQTNLDKLSKQAEMMNTNSSAATTAAAQTVTEDNPFAVSVAQFVLDTAGFHGMAESISTTQKIDAAYPGAVNRAYKVLSQTVWPQPIAEQGNAFVAMLKDFATALTDNKIEDATKLSDQVHDAQHELSAAIDDWKATAKAPVSTSVDPFALRMAQFVLDTAGFHGMAESISTTQKIDTAYPGTVNRAYKVLSQTIWPDTLAEQGKAFVTTLKAFATALTDNKIEDATTLSDQVHDAQHELSAAIDDWFSVAANVHTH